MFSVFDKIKSLFFNSNTNKRKSTESIETLSKTCNDQNKENKVINDTVYSQLFNIDRQCNINDKSVTGEKYEIISAKKGKFKKDLKEKDELDKVLQTFNVKAFDVHLKNNGKCNGTSAEIAIKKTTSIPTVRLNHNFNNKSHLLDRNLIDKLSRRSIYADSRESQLKICNIESATCENEIKELEPSYLQDISDRFRGLWTSDPTILPRVVKKSLLPKITNEMTVLVLSTLSSKNKDAVVVEEFSLSVTVIDIYSLQPRQWLTDNIINFYLELINLRNNSDKKYPQIQILTSFFYPKLTSAGYSGVKRWTKRRPIFASQMVLVPIHLGNHWCLVTIDMVNEEVFYYDSLKNPAPRILNEIKNFLIEDSKDKLNKSIRTEDWTFAQKYDGPSQTNGYDCGVFLCQTAEYAARRAKLDFKQDQMEYFREKMSYEIITAALL